MFRAFRNLVIDGFDFQGEPNVIGVLQIIFKERGPLGFQSVSLGFPIDGWNRHVEAPNQYAPFSGGIDRNTQRDY
jgi:hypothetical protein